MLTPEARAIIDSLLAEEASTDVRARMLADLDDAEALQRLTLEYNWDEGFELPTAIASHPRCDLGTALCLFWLSAADEWLSRTSERGQSNPDWASFCMLISNRIKNGDYPRGPTSFKAPIGPVQKHKLKKAGVPEVFMTNVESDLPAPTPWLRG